MRIVLEQEVFPFLAEDPEYQEAVQAERIWRSVTARFDEKLELRIARIVEAKLEELVSAAFERKYSEIVADLGRMHLRLAHIWTVLSEDDPADWWKEGYECEEDEDEVA
jgi:hypothetical protein